ncbi:Lrp/AsnC family transcriptional regulator [Candidatus Nitrosotenuis cloacae]|jgi:DNA-binding Lrp family transcriptional regulator|uniref:AsnC family transcriptional regulator n=1 Tax=Candidatus Nitrosotenuis cloacae TaxID=1603555 RepID=A0A3G1B2W1_9ARCH|nr:Lrp/AsnC ligand binding domain-containing protein [Candidatus Nitrosotenuis cloacae]AJZ75084.1 AsnC family transcriptional regulator [Candidatus Nitrosotenuis cloacae]
MEVGFVLLNCDLGAEEYLLDEIKQIPEVKQAYLTFGAYDIIIEIHTKTPEDFDRTVSNKIRRLSRVMSTMTLKVLASKTK